MSDDLFEDRPREPERTRRAALALATLLLSSASTLASAQPAASEQSTSDSGATVQEIVVTAQKQTESLQDAPAAITAIGGIEAARRGISDINAVQDLIPSVRFQQQSASTEIFIRGVGGSLDFANVEPTTNFNFNGVYIPREGTSVPLYDLQQIEVLPGPQGTLYGRGAVGGVVNVIFARPTRSWETRLMIEAGNYDLRHVTAVQNIPLSDTLFLRAAIDYTDRDGYLTSGADSRDDVSGRLSLLYEPKAGTSVYLWGYSVDKNGSPANALNRGFDPRTFTPNDGVYLHSDPFDDTFTGPLAAFAAFGPPRAEKQTYNNHAVGAQVDHGVNDELTLSFIPSYFYLDWSQDYWLGALPASGGAEYRLATGELRLAYDAERTKALLGLYGYRQAARGSGDFAGFSASYVARNRIEGVALFGEATHEFTERFRLTAGARYSLDDRLGRGFAPDFTGAPAIPYSLDKTFRHFDWKVGVQYDLAPTSMAYATVQTGYQPGTFNEIPSSATFNNLVKEAELTALTTGIKNRFFDNRVQLNVEAFYYDYKNLFQQSFDAGVVNPIFNAKKVEVYGVQVDGVMKVTRDDQLSLAVGYLHGETVDFTTPSGAVFNGVQLAMSPTWTVSAGYYHDFHLARGYVRASVDSRYSASFCSDFTRGIGTCQDSYVKTNASLAYYDEDRWSVALWIKNIEDRAVIARSGIGGIPGPAVTFLESPRTFGVRLSYGM